MRTCDGRVSPYGTNLAGASFVFLRSHVLWSLTNGQRHKGKYGHKTVPAALQILPCPVCVCVCVLVYPK